MGSGGRLPLLFGGGGPRRTHGANWPAAPLPPLPGHGGRQAAQFCAKELATNVMAAARRHLAAAGPHADDPDAAFEAALPKARSFNIFRRAFFLFWPSP